MTLRSRFLNCWASPVRADRQRLVTRLVPQALATQL